MSIYFFSYMKDRDPVKMPARPADSHKGNFGKVLCVCGSVGMSGAAYFAAKACYRMGAGLVRILTVEENRVILQTLLPEAMISVYDPSDPNGVQTAVEWADVLVVGCGLGTSSQSRFLLSQVLRLKGDRPTVLDADALNLLSSSPTLLKYARGCVLTPHVGEMSRLTDLSCEDILAAPASVTQAFAKTHGLICVLKGHNTLVSDGTENLYRNASGNSGLATGGSGDVLAGMIGGILAQAHNGALSTMNAACLGVYLHGLCGDEASAKLSEYSVMASDVIDAIPRVMQRI